jgi:predicted nucleic acid-binding protein
MPAVSDTSPILGLAVIGHLNLLQEQFEEIYIPQAVLEELKTESDFRGVPIIQQALQEDWIKVKEVKNKPLAQSLALDLNQGESDAIALAIDLNIKIIVIDERLGRDRARNMGLETIGVLGILLTAKKHNRIKSIKSAMAELRNEIGFFISEDLYKKVLHQAGE